MRSGPGSPNRAARAGCTIQQHEALLALGHEAQAAGLPERRWPLRSYQLSKQEAKKRGIEWKFNAWEWWITWRDSGHWDDRAVDGYVMCRRGDVGPYSADNVVIAPAQLNLSSGNRDASLPVGVFPQPNGRFRARRIIDRTRHELGYFDTADEAHAAYLAAGPDLDLTQYDDLRCPVDRAGAEAGRVALPLAPANGGENG